MEHSLATTFQLLQRSATNATYAIPIRTSEPITYIIIAPPPSPSSPQEKAAAGPKAAAEKCLVKSARSPAWQSPLLLQWQSLLSSFIGKSRDQCGKVYSPWEKAALTMQKAVQTV
jgi:hypothetical protein